MADFTGESSMRHEKVEQAAANTADDTPQLRPLALALDTSPVKLPGVSKIGMGEEDRRRSLGCCDYASSQSTCITALALGQAAATTLNASVNTRRVSPVPTRFDSAPAAEGGLESKVQRRPLLTVSPRSVGCPAPQAPRPVEQDRQHKRRRLTCGLQFDGDLLVIVDRSTGAIVTAAE